MPRYKLAYSGPTRVAFIACSGNLKTGPIPVSITSSNTCPPSCPWYGNGCYSENTHVANRWGKLHRGMGMSWGRFCGSVSQLLPDQLWRHDEAGDLPGDGEMLDVPMFDDLIEANRGRRGFTYTHKPMRSAAARAAVRKANTSGFTVNLSADSLAQADALAALDIGPVVVTLPPDALPCRTPAGRKVAICPAQLRPEVVQCATCALCHRADRSSIVGFRVHSLRMKQAESYARRNGLSIPARKPVDMRLVRWPYEG